MSGKPETNQRKRCERGARDARLAFALRDNLRRRKEQRRAQQELAAPASAKKSGERDRPLE